MDSGRSNLSRLSMPLSARLARPYQDSMDSGRSNLSIPSVSSARLAQSYHQQSSLPAVTGHAAPAPTASCSALKGNADTDRVAGNTKARQLTLTTNGAIHL